MTSTTLLELRSQATVETVIGFLKANHGVNRYRPAAGISDAALTAGGYNSKCILAWLRSLVSLIKSTPKLYVARSNLLLYFQRTLPQATNNAALQAQAVHILRETPLSDRLYSNYFKYPFHKKASSIRRTSE